VEVADFAFFFLFSAAFLFFSALSFMHKAEFFLMRRIHFLKGFFVGFWHAGVAAVTIVVALDGALERR
jgi:hypothetical protein